MKNKFVFLLLVFNIVSWSITAQSFEGLIQWTCEAALTDPRLQKKVEEGAEKLNNPETQKALTQLKEKMNDPEFKKIMDQNPAIREQMEMVLDQMSGAPQSQGAGLNSFLPTGMTIKIKDGNSLIKMTGGMAAMMGEILNLKDKGETYRIYRENKTYTKIPEKTDGVDKKTAAMKVTKTEEFASILGHQARKYIVEKSNKKGKTVYNIWATTELSEFDPKMMSRMKLGKDQEDFWSKDIEGFPLRIQVINDEINMTMQVSEISKQTLNPADFSIPAGYKLVEGF